MRHYKKLILLLAFITGLTSIRSVNANENLKPVSKEEALRILAQANMQPESGYTNPDNLPSVLVFYTDWCGYCKQMIPSIKRLEEDFKGKIHVKKINLEAEHDFAKKYRMGENAVPHLQIYSAEGKLLRNQVGYQSYERIKQEIEVFL
jgi:thioredoxin 1